jgi:hypothetical protein
MLSYGTWQLRSLDGVDILVDTMAVLAIPRLDETDEDDLKALIKRSSNRMPVTPEPKPNTTSPTTPDLAASYASLSSIARHIDFHRNESFAASLRAERERRMESWSSLFEDDIGEGLLIVHSLKRTMGGDLVIFTELHQLAKIFYTGTNIVAIRDAARRRSSREIDTASQSESSDSGSVPLTLLTVEMACPKRRIEVPDDDSSFLLRAQVCCVVVFQ